MRRKVLLVLKIIAAWQVIALVIGAAGFLRHSIKTEPQLSPEEFRLVSSLLHPTEADLRTSVSEVQPLRFTSKNPKSDAWESALVSSLQAADADAMRRLLIEKRGSIQQVPYDEISILIDALVEHPNSVDVESRLAEVLSRVSYRFGGLEAWTWQLWDRANTPVQRARLAGVLAAFRDDKESGVLLRAALRFGSVSPDFSNEDFAHLAMPLAQILADSDQLLPALALYREIEQRTVPGPIWGPAAFNEGLVLHRAGYQSAARQALLRVIASSVNDREPGASLMRTNQNYRHWGANLVADSYLSDGAFPLAYWWRLRAAEHYRFYSWCGTCSDSAEHSISLRMLRDAMLAGPVVVIGHMIAYPNRTWFVWSLIAAGGVITAWRHRRRARGQI